MGISRIVNTDFWTDSKVMDTYSPEDKYFWLYLLTNPQTRQLGVYKLPKKLIAFQTGYSSETVNTLLDRFESQYKSVVYSHETQEIAILNYLNYSVLKGGKPVVDCLNKDISLVSNKDLLSIVYARIKDNNSKPFMESIKELLSVYENEIYNDIYIYSIVPRIVPRIVDDKKKAQAVNKKDIDTFFESVWCLYPLKKGKASISETQKKKLFAIGYDELKRAIERYDSEVKDKQYMKHGSTFFNGGYVDYLDENYQEPEKKEEPDRYDNAMFRAIGRGVSNV